MLNEILVGAAWRGNAHVAIQFPPRHGKSTLSCWYFPAWYLGRWPDRQVMMTTHEAGFAEMWGGRVRDTLVEHGGPIFGVRVSPDAAASHWRMEGRAGGMMTAGVGGSITGRGADLLICDDPIKNFQEAMSETIRNAIWNWWTTTAYTRREPGATCVVIMTRWHRDDLIGRLISPEWNENWRDWTVISFPAIAGENDPAGRQPGEALWPERYPLSELAHIRGVLGSAWFEGLYQQNPVAVSEGIMFRRHWFGIVEEAPVECRWCRYWDLAATEAKRGDPDWTAGALLGLHEGVWYVADMRRVRVTPREVEMLVAQCAAVDPPHTSIRMEQEPGSSGVNTIDHYARQVLVGCDFQGVRSTGSKIERARPLSAAAEAGNVKLVNGPWVHMFLDEAESFPGGAHDDQVDAASGAMIANAAGSWDEVRVTGPRLSLPDALHKTPHARLSTPLAELKDF